MLIQPDTDVMERNLCHQPRPKPAEIRGSLPVQTQGMNELLIDGLDDLTDPRQPTTPRLRPRRLAMPLGWTPDLGPRGLPPRRMMRLPLTALIDDVGSQRGCPHARHSQVRPATQSKEGVGEGVGFGAGRSKAKAGHHPHGVDRQQERAPFIPAQTIPPAISASPGSHPAPWRLASEGREV